MIRAVKMRPEKRPDAEEEDTEMKLAIRSAFVAALCILLSAAAYAEPNEPDYFYSGPLDSVTGQPVSSSSAQTQVRLADGMYYDFDRRAYAYPVGDGLYEVYASVADGMIVTERVSISANDGAALNVYRDGEALENVNLSEISQTGDYAVTAKSGDSTVNLFSFRIVGPETNLSGYSMPAGFYILEATRGEEEAFYERSYIGMQEEGFYHIEYICPANELRYTLETTIDRTPPQIELEGRRDEEGRFHSAVDVRGLEQGDTVSMTYNDVSAAFPADGRLDESGIYTLWVTDSAGNTAMEQFAIMVYFDLNSLIFFALICASLAGVLGYMLYKRKKLKVM